MNDFYEKRQQLRQSYMASMIDKREALQQYYSQFKQSDDDVEDFYTALHKLSGSAGMYGFIEISANARVLMNTIKGTSNDGFSPSDDIGELFTGLLEMMKNIK